MAAAGVSDDGDLTALRVDNWKLVFLEQRAPGTLQVWAEPFTPLRVPKMFNLRTDPYERADVTSNTYYDWMLDHAWLCVPMQSYVAEMLQTFAEFPPRQKPATFSLDRCCRSCRPASPAHERTRDDRASRCTSGRGPGVGPGGHLPHGLR